MRISVRAKPGSKKEEVKELAPDRLEVKVSAPPEKGSANERVIELLAEHYGVRRSAVKILRGHSSREKLIEIDL